MLTVADLIILFGHLNNQVSGVNPVVPQIMLVSMLVFIFITFKFLLRDTESINILDLLWRVFVTGLVTTIASLLIRLFLYILAGSTLVQNPLLINLFYHINIGLIAIFLISTFVVWKKLILYQKSKTLIKSWRIFLYSLFLSLFFSFLGYDIFELPFNIVLGILLIEGIILSANLKWVAYINFKQKWKSILLIILVILYLWYFIVNLFEFPLPVNVDINLINNVSVLSLFIFIFIYAVFSLLVILFNLPTSSVFEQKLEEVLNFQRLSQSSQNSYNEEQVYDILLDSSVSAVMANAAWIEVEADKLAEKRMLKYKIDEQEILEIKNKIDTRKIKKLMESDPNKSLAGSRFNATIQDSYYKSVLAYPIYVQNKQIGSLVLLKDVTDGFNREMMEIIRTFVSQASISIENFRLLSQAIANERYKEELKIAKRVQRALLPDQLHKNDDFHLAAFSKAADEVGGDYYDTFKITEERFAIIIGDVSGKGTSAAFHMSQMKGIFHSLVQLNLSAKDFLIHANSALSRCLEKSSFITVSYFIIDTKQNSVEFARAGHCPTLYYSATAKEVVYVKSRGLGLGILRNDNFKQYIEISSLQYHPGDIIILYTDGIIEARNKNKEFFGYSRLQNFVSFNAHKSVEALQEDLLKELYAFCDKEPPDDDFTTFIIKFN
jgi:phosphoserine phosphatase RsbU/P